MGMNNRLLRPRQNLHPDAASWAARVVANGGSVGTSLSAVNKFCKDIDAAGLRDRFYRLNLFCGGTSGTAVGLNSALVPLYRGPSLSGTQYGGTTDTNNGPFFGGDYAETGASSGLSGNGSNKYLDTGVPMNFTGLRNYHLSSFVFQRSAAHNYFMIGADTNTDAVSPRAMQALASFNTSPLQYVWYNIGTDFVQVESQSNSYIPGLLTGVGGTSGNNLYAGGSSVASGAAAVNETITRTFPIFVFAHNRNNTPLSFANVRMGGYSIGLSMTASQVASYNTAFAAFNTALSRT